MDAGTVSTRNGQPHDGLQRAPVVIEAGDLLLTTPIQ